MKIVIINHTFQQKEFCKRWELLAEAHQDWEVILLAPSEWTWGRGKAVTFGNIEKKTGYELDNDNFHVKKIAIKQRKYFGWVSQQMIERIREENPDCIYHIGSHTQESLMQILDYKKKNPNLKVFAFSMRGPQQDLANIVNLRHNDSSLIKKGLRVFQYFYEKIKVEKLNRFCDAVFCHYPSAKESFIKEGYGGPIFIQTQVGVDTEVFYPDDEKRRKTRIKYNISDSTYLFGSAVRFNPSKGVLQVLESLPKSGDWKYLLMGSGLKEEIETVRDKISEMSIEDKVILPGFIQWSEMPDHWNAVDCAIHFTQTTPTWIETFSLSLVQAMATRIPVIGSLSGSIPYQVGPKGIFCDEKDIDELNRKIEWVMQHREKGEEIGEELYFRTINSFSIKHLNDMFYQTVNALLNGTNCDQLYDMVDNN